MQDQASTFFSFLIVIFVTQDSILVTTSHYQDDSSDLGALIFNNRHLSSDETLKRS